MSAPEHKSGSQEAAVLAALPEGEPRKSAWTRASDALAKMEEKRQAEAERFAARVLAREDAARRQAEERRAREEGASAWQRPIRISFGAWLGGLMVIAGAGGMAYFGLKFQVTVWSGTEWIANLDYMNQRMMGLIASGFVFLAGVFLAGVVVAFKRN